MKKLALLFLSVLLLSCSRGWKNPIEVDPNLAPPVIEHITLDAQSNIVLYLSIGYNQDYTIVLERKAKGGFERISYIRLSQAALVDTSFDKELDYNFGYRVRVEKNGYRTDYSTEKPFDYVSKILNAPAGLQATTLELQGVKLEWKDRSSKETGFKIERNTGNGFVEITSLSANSQSYFDAIGEIPPLPLHLSYRVKAFASSLASRWVEAGTSYTGIGIPTNLQITDTTFDHFTIEWHDNSKIETGYIVERKKDGPAFNEIAQLRPNVTQYTDQITEIGTYGYRVRAKKDNLYSDYTNEVSSEFAFTGFLNTWEMSSEYSWSNNPNNTWSYGRKWSPDASNFDLMTARWGDTGWYVGNAWHPSMQAGVLLWANNNLNGLPVVRWKNPEPGFYNLSCTFTGADARGVSVTVYMSINNSVKFSENISSNNEAKNFSLDKIHLDRGNDIDFLVKWTGNGDPNNNWTKVNAIIRKYRVAVR